MGKTVLGCAVMLLMLALPAAPSYGMNYGSLQFDPYVSLRETLTDNVFSTPDDRRHDLISALTPGIRLIYPFRTHRIDLDYHAVLTRYKTYSSERTDDHFVNGAVDLKFGSHVGLKLSDVYMKNHEPRSSSSTGYIVKYTNNTARASLAYQLADRSKVQVDLGQASWDFEGDANAFRDRREGLFSGYFYYRFQPKTSAFVEVDRKKASYSTASVPALDNTMDSFLLGIKWEMTRRSEGTVKLGRTRKDFDDGAVEDYSSWTGSMDIKHRFDESNSVKVTGLREINEANLQGTYYFVTTGAALEVTHKFGYRLSGIAAGSYGTDKYSNAVYDPSDGTFKDRKDNTTLFGLGLKYLIREWLEAGVDYLYRTRDSNINANDYSEHRYSVTVSAAF
jgi:polysaccharide biosynthesis protein VpsM